MNEDRACVHCGDLLAEGRRGSTCSAHCWHGYPLPARLTCTVCSTTLTTVRRLSSPTALTCSQDCSITHQANSNRVLNRGYQRARRARRKVLHHPDTISEQSPVE